MLCKSAAGLPLAQSGVILCTFAVTGNLLRTADGKLCYLDFGMMGQVDLSIRQALIRATLHLVNGEYGPLAEDFVSLGFLPAGSDKSLIVPALTGVFKVRCSSAGALR